MIALSIATLAAAVAASSALGWTSSPGRARWSAASVAHPPAPIAGGLAAEQRAVRLPPERVAQSAKSLSAPAQAVDAYWVQVGAYRDAEAATRLAQRLREQKYRVQESVVTRASSPAEPPSAVSSPAAPGSSHRYEVVVAGRSPSGVQAQLSSMGLTSRAAAEGAVVTPSLELAEAVALSRELSESGLTVRVRRINSTTGVAPPATKGGAEEVLYRVRVGGFADRAAALAALKELESRGYKPFLARGNE